MLNEYIYKIIKDIYPYLLQYLVCIRNLLAFVIKYYNFCKRYLSVPDKFSAHNARNQTYQIQVE